MFHVTKPLNRNQKYLLLSSFCLYFLIAAFLLQPLPEIWQGLITIIKEPDFLITDYIALGGIGAAFINASILTLVCIAILYHLNMDVDGHSITALFLMMGFSLFGKNILNIWSILAGIWVYAHYHKVSVSKYIYIGFYGTSLSPIITQIMLLNQIPLPLRLPLSIVIGILIGFVLPPLSAHFKATHKGFSLYNVGFASGIIATIIMSVFKSLGLPTTTRLIWSTGNNGIFIWLLSIFFLCLIIMGLLISDTSIYNYEKILKTSGISGTDYTQSTNFGGTFINMGVNGMFCLLFLFFLGADLNGPTIGGIFTIVGFSATGKHLRNIVPIMLGVWLADFAKSSWAITDPSPIITLLFSTTLAPIAGQFGFFAGILAGFLHSSVALNVGSIYGGMNLYNNGFAGGIVAAFLVPVFQSISDRRNRVRGDSSL